MSVKQNRTTTANTGKPSTAEKAAGKEAPAIRDEIQREIRELKKLNTSLTNRVYKAAMVAREIQATEEENKALLREIPKQRRADYRRIVGAPEDHFGLKAPKNLGKLARYLTHRAEGEDDATSAEWAEKGRPVAKKGTDARETDKSGSPDLSGQGEGMTSPESSGKTAAAPEPIQSSNVEQGPLAKIRDGINMLERDYPNDKTIQQACRALNHALDTAGRHIAKVA